MTASKPTSLGTPVPSTLSRNAALLALLSPTLSREAPISSIAQLLFAEEALDDMAAMDDLGSEYQDLQEKARVYIKAHSVELLAAPWLRISGAVFDLIEAEREKGYL